MPLIPKDFRQKLQDVYDTKSCLVSFLSKAAQIASPEEVETACNDLWMILDNPGPPCVDIADLFALLPDKKSRLGIHVVTSIGDKTLSTIELEINPSVT